MVRYLLLYFCRKIWLEICEYSNKYCSYKFIVARNLREKQFLDVMTLTELKTGL